METAVNHRSGAVRAAMASERLPGRHSGNLGGTDSKSGKRFDLATADPTIQRALQHAPTAGLKAMKEKLPTLARVANGWQMNTDTMGVYGNYYLKRAIIALLV